MVYCEIPPKIITLNKLIAYPLNAFNENINSENYDKNYITNNESISFIAKLCGVSRISIKTSLSLFDLLDKKELRVNQYDK